MGEHKKKTSDKKINLLPREYKRLKYLKEEITLMFLYPRLDAHVSTDIGHLLKAPFCVHPKTGKVCVPFKTENLNTFDPFTAPTLPELVKDYSKGHFVSYFNFICLKILKMRIYSKEGCMIIIIALKISSKN